MKYIINYFDLGTHKGQAIDALLKQLEHNNSFSEINIYGIEAHPDFFSEILNKYKDTNKIHFFFYNFAVGSKEGVTKLFLHSSDLGHSIYPDKSGVTSNTIIVQERIFSNWLKEIVPKQKLGINILKVNIEGAEWDLINDLNKNNLFNYFDIYLGSAPEIFNDISKVKSLVSENAVERYQAILKENKIIIKKFCPHNPQWKDIDINREIDKIIRYKKRRQFLKKIKSFSGIRLIKRFLL